MNTVNQASGWGFKTTFIKIFMYLLVIFFVLTAVVQQKLFLTEYSLRLLIPSIFIGYLESSRKNISNRNECLRLVKIMPVFGALTLLLFYSAIADLS